MNCRPHLHLLLCAALLLPSTVRAELMLEHLAVKPAAQTVLLDLGFAVRDPQSQIAGALTRGEVWLEVEIHLLRPHWLWGDEVLGRLVLLRTLSYDPLKQHYRIHQTHHAEQHRAYHLDAALTRLLRFDTVPVTRLDWLPEHAEGYRGDIQARLYANPMPLTPMLDPIRTQTLDWHSPKVSWSLP